MKLTTKTLAQTLILSFALTTLTIICMDQPAHQTKQAVDKILKKTLRSEITKPHLTGQVVFAFDPNKKHNPVGYGCKNCIKKLKKMDITIKQSCPLAKVSILINDCATIDKEHPLATDVTESFGLAYTVSDAVKHIADKIIDQRLVIVKTLINQESDDFYDTFGYEFMIDKDKLEDERYKLRQEFFETVGTTLPDLPSFLPVEHLIQGKITIENELCSIHLTFNQHAVLENLLKEFQQRPTIFTYVSSDIDAVNIPLDEINRKTAFQLIKAGIIKQIQPKSGYTHIMHKDTVIHSDLDINGKNIFKHTSKSSIDIKNLAKRCQVHHSNKSINKKQKSHLEIKSTK